MYKVLIAEDMDLTREDLLHLIDWEKHGFSLIPDARNGKIGLDYAMQYRPDIIITDIKMPVMTGLDMVSELEKRGYEAEVILLTAYEEFELAKRALQMELVRSFLLKYEIDEELLLRELNKCAVRIENRRHLSRLSSRQKILDALINVPEEVSGEDLLGWEGRTTLFLVRRLGNSKEECGEERLQTVLEEQLGEEKLRVLRLDLREYVILVQGKTILSELKQKTYIKELAAQVLTAMERACHAPMAVSIGGIAARCAELPNRFQKAAERMQGFAFASPGAVLEEEIDRASGPLPGEMERCLEQIAGGLEEDAYDTVRERLRELQLMLRKNRNLYWLRKAEERLLYFITDKSAQLRSEELEESINALREDYRELQLVAFMERYGELVHMSDEWEEGRYSQKVRFIRSYVQKHYAEDITLQQLSEEIGMSAIYLSTLFKKETGLTFSAYLADVRIERAIELLRQGDYKIYEISELVGYQTVQYFYKVFKKKTGKNPRDFCR